MFPAQFCRACDLIWEMSAVGALLLIAGDGSVSLQGSHSAGAGRPEYSQACWETTGTEECHPERRTQMSGGEFWPLCVCICVDTERLCFDFPSPCIYMPLLHVISFCPFHSIVCILSLPTFAILLVHYSTASLGRWLPPHWSSSGGGCILLKGNPFFTSSLSACSQRSSDC